MTSIYVGNLSNTTTEDDLLEAFSRHGTVTKVSLVKDRETGRPRGFAFIDMADGKEAATAIKELNLAEIGGRSITVNEARPKSDRPRRGGGGGGGGRSRW
jgi:cold-inducible RNA-binding protein